MATSLQSKTAGSSAESSYDGLPIRLGWGLPTMTVREVIERHGHFAHGGNPDDAAETWIESGFDADGVEEWLNARCFDPSVARDLADAGVAPADARMKTDAGAGDYTDTVGFKVSAGDLEVEEARDLLGVT
jgi:hypothetical protein